MCDAVAGELDSGGRMTAMYDVAAFRAQFPALAEGAAHFDGPGGSQTPLAVAAAVREAMLSAVANRGDVTPAERRADVIVVAAREAIGDLLAASPRGIVFGRSMTQVTYDVSRALAKTWRRGDEVVVTRLDHDANVRPWVQAAEAAGALVRFADFDPATGELAVEQVAAVVGERTRLVAVTAASNLIGTRPDVPAIMRLAHEVGALGYVDGVHATAHAPIDVAALGADLFACSPYKFLGPHCGALAAAPELLESLHPDKLLPSIDDVPERFELGTLPYELLAGVTACVDVLDSLAGDQGAASGPVDASGPAPDARAGRRARLVAAMGAVAEHEDRLRERIEEALAAVGAQVYSRAARRTPTLLFRLPGIPDDQVRRRLAERGINAPNGSFYAIECSRHLGLGDAGAVRVGLAPYSDDDDVDRLCAALHALRH